MGIDCRETASASQTGRETTNRGDGVCIAHILLRPLASGDPKKFK